MVNSANTTQTHVTVSGWKEIYNDSNYTLKCNGNLCSLEVHISSLSVNKWSTWSNSTTFTGSSFNPYMPSRNISVGVNSYLTELWLKSDGLIGVANQSDWDYTGGITGILLYPMK
jgi:hypothetical protein